MTSALVFFRMFLSGGTTLLLLLAGVSCAPDNARSPSERSDYQRIVSLSGAITETLFTLGHGDRIVGVDVTSTYPPEVKDLPNLGHSRQLNVEAVLGLSPDLLIADSSARVNPALARLREAGVEVLFWENSYTLDSPLELAGLLSGKLGGEAALAQFKARYERQRAELSRYLADKSDRPRVLFIYARGQGSMMVAGRETSAEAMIQAAGGQNAANGFEGFRALSPEGLLQARPEALLLFTSGLRSVGGVEGLLSLPGMRKTPAGKAGRVIAMDGAYLLGFGPRSAEAALDLAGLLRMSEQAQPPEQKQREASTGSAALSSRR
jgi:iron complex transport system substrate-binding protein